MRGYGKPAKNNYFELSDRLIGAFSYLTIGFVGFIWLIIAAVTGKTVKPFVRFQIYQSIFISILIYLFNLLLGIIINVLAYIPVISSIVIFIVFNLAQNPVIFGFSIVHAAFILSIAYLAWMAFTGRQVEIPWISSTIRQLG